MDKRLMNIMVCTLCHSPLVYDKEKQLLICKTESLAYPIIKGIPVMLSSKAKKIVPEII